MTIANAGLLPADAAPAAGRHRLSIAVADYDRTRPLIDGRVDAKGLTLDVDARHIGDFCRRPVYEEYDAAEMSFSWFVTARGRGEPVVALPVFLLRMSVLAFVYVRADSPITRPADLIGKRIGSRGYRQTVNLWLRGIFQEHYGLSPEQVTWVLAETVEGAGYTIPSHIPVEYRSDSTAIANLRDGTVDAMVCTSVPKEFLAGEPWIRRLFPDCQAEMQRYARDVGFLPITHVLVMNQALADAKPWIAANLTEAFMAAQQAADSLCMIDPKRLSLPDSVFILEQQRAAYGTSPYVHGIEPNRKNIETFLRYAFQQGYTSRNLAVEDLFVGPAQA
jgi:4,5-dihydroxyphthalate decarboxylase